MSVKKMPLEKTNEGLSGAPNKKVGAAHGQNSDEMGTKNKLVPQTAAQVDSYHETGKDFPYTSKEALTGQDGMAAGFSEGKNQLATGGEYADDPRCNEDGGMGKGAGTPSGWSSGERSARIAAAFPIEQNRGEGNDEGGQTSVTDHVDLVDGYVGASDYTPTRLKETPAARAFIPN